ncbi:MAG: 4-hydroxythreonine-4-phosphate dehydrogenase PdxA [Candidatus Omnitrophota bacterium]
MRKTRIGITLGDPCGVGPEIILKSLLKSPIRKLTQFVIIGDSQVFSLNQRRKLSFCAFAHQQNSRKTEFKPGHPSQKSAQASLDYLKLACRLLKGKKIDALVTGPLSKELICSLGIPFSGHTEFLARYFKTKNFDMMFIADGLKMVVATRHIPLKEVSRQLTITGLFSTITLTHQALVNYFHIKKPRIALCGLNPHAGENGVLGDEDMKVIAPAVFQAQEKGLNVFGPIAADTLFCPINARPYDCLIAMYHDQGLAPMKALYFDKLVNITIGLPIIRTSPAHGTAFAIAGKNIADPRSMMEAILLASRLCSKKA